MVKSGRAYGDGSIRQRADGKWRGVVEQGRDPVTGKRKRKYVVRSTESACKTAVRALREGDEPRGARRSPAALTVAQYLDQWIAAGAGGVNVQTARRYAGLVRYQLKPTLGHYRLEQLRAEHVRAALNAMESMPRRSTTGTPVPGERLSSATIRQAHRVILKAVSDAVHDGMLERDYLRGRVRPPQLRPVTPGRALTVDEARRVLDAAMDTPMPARWLLALTTGLRQAEVLGLTWPAVVWPEHRVDITTQLHYLPREHGCPESTRCEHYHRPCPPSEACSGAPARGCTHAWHRARNRPCPQTRDHAACPLGGPCRYTARLCPQATGGPVLVRRTKGGRDRLILLTPDTEAALRAHQDGQAAARRAADRRWETRPGLRDLVFSGSLGQPVNPRADNKAWKALLDDAGVDEARLHDARHTTATILAALGIDPGTVQTLLGHSSLATTQGYQHATAEMLAPAMAALQAALTGDAVSPRAAARPRR